MKIIALSGKKQSGKDTVYLEACQYFSELEDQKIRCGRVGFADPLKHEVSVATGFRTDFIEEHKQGFRTLLQVWGTDFRRQFFGNDYWINKMDEIIKKSTEFFDVMFITDLRFKNEADFVKDAGGYVVRVERRSFNSYPESDTSERHISEHDMNDYSEFDYVLNNDKTQDELRESIGKMIDTLKIIKNAA